MRAQTAPGNTFIVHQNNIEALQDWDWFLAFTIASFTIDKWQSKMVANLRNSICL